MNKFTYKKKFHFLIKYIALGLPLLIILFSSFRGSSWNYLYDFSNEFLNLSINSWYLDLLELLSFDNLTSNFGIVLCSVPLYILWVYAFDLLIDILGFVLTFAHSLLYKFGGGLND